MRLARLLPCLVLCSAIFTTLSLSGQSSVRTLTFIPSHPTEVIGRIDPAAMQEITAHRSKVAGSAQWTGLQGTGRIQYGSDPTTYDATLVISGRTKFRLDAQAANGSISIRINGRIGKIQEADGRVFPLPPDTATTGLLQFELPRMEGFPEQAFCSLIDRGGVAIDGEPFHQVTYEMADHKAADGKSVKTIPTELFFDPTTHLLVKSLNMIRLDGAGPNEFQRVITYEDYRQVGDSLIPFRFTQTLNGQKQWTLQLSDVQLNPGTQSNYFQF